MSNQILSDLFLSRLKRINLELQDHLIKINFKKGLPVWTEHIERGGQIVCGVGRTIMFVCLILELKVTKELVKEYAQYLRDEIMGSSYDLGGLKEAVKWVLDYELVREQKAIMFGLQSQFWKYLGGLTERAYIRIITELPTMGEEYRDDFEKDEKTLELLEPTILKLFDEDVINRDLDEKLFRDSLDSQEKEIYDDWKAGHGVRHSAKKLNIDKDKIAKKRKEIEAAKRERDEEDED